MTKRLGFIVFFGMSLMACGGSAPADNAANKPANAPANTANTTANAPANTSGNTPANTAPNANSASEKPGATGPKRVSFAAGKSEGTESLTLAAGETKQFVVGAKLGQIFMADTDSKDIEITMVKGKDSAQMKEPGHYDSTLLADGDYVFQVKNTSKKEVKTSMTVTISHTSVSKP
jgi:hypothetical protein